mgnify:CR=1 FL=1
MGKSVHRPRVGQRDGAARRVGRVIQEVIIAAAVHVGERAVGGAAQGGRVRRQGVQGDEYRVAVVERVCVHRGGGDAGAVAKDVAVRQRASEFARFERLVRRGQPYLGTTVAVAHGAEISQTLAAADSE